MKMIATGARRLFLKGVDGGPFKYVVELCTHLGSLTNGNETEHDGHSGDIMFSEIAIYFE